MPSCSSNCVRAIRTSSSSPPGNWSVSKNRTPSSAAGRTTTTFISPVIVAVSPSLSIVFHQARAVHASRLCCRLRPCRMYSDIKGLLWRTRIGGLTRCLIYEPAEPGLRSAPRRGRPSWSRVCSERRDAPSRYHDLTRCLRRRCGHSSTGHHHIAPAHFGSM
jgi:hypothetical protein